jgi:multiple sugar transport system substrate-binding protein
MCLALSAALAVAPLVACGNLRSNADAKVSITVWDYYGSSTPIKPALAAFKREHPNIEVRYQEREYDDIRLKFPAEAAKGNGPDVSTLDMTWLSTIAADGLLADLGELSGGKINGRSVEHVYASAALNAMTYEGKQVAAPFDYDTYALYYRADLLAAEGLPVPETWAQFRATAKALAETADDTGRTGKARVQIVPDTFHFAQILFQQGGDILDPTGTQAAFAGREGVQALEAFRALLQDGGIYWGPGHEKDPLGTAAMKEGRIAMFINGPYMMGVLRTEAPELAGKWGVARVPTDGKPGSYLGGTGLAIPASSTKKDAAWSFVQFMLRKEQQLGVLKHAGAAPTTNEAVLSADLSDPDPYFGGQTPFLTFLQAVATAKHFPYIKHWSDVNAIIDTAVEAALTGKKSPKQALAEAAKKVNALLATE